MPPHVALNHIEKTLSDSYRKEIDQEENVWRTMPFFATAISLELAASGQLITRLPSLTTVEGWFALTCLVLMGISLISGCCLLFRCLLPQQFAYLPEDALLYQYAEGLIEAEKAGHGLPGQIDAEDLLKKTLAHQYGVATDNNRKINKKRELWRAQAGLAVAFSMLFTILVAIAVVVAHYDQHEPGIANGQTDSPQSSPERRSPSERGPAGYRIIDSARPAPYAVGNEDFLADSGQPYNGGRVGEDQT